MLVIHGIDLLAKDKPDLCRRLITTAKVMTNDNHIKMALVSSKGTIMPLVKSMSATNRAVIFEIGDISDEKSIHYLIDNGIQEKL